MENCYAILSSVREGLNEYSTAWVQGTEIGSYTNRYLIGKINAAQRFIHSLVARRVKSYSLKSATLTAVSSVYTLPSDFGRLLYFKDSDGNKISPISPADITPTASAGSPYHYYRKGNTLVLDEAGSTSTATLLYVKKPRDITTGMASAGGALSITLATTAEPVADYYNDMTIENITQSWTDTISDYSAARVATIAATAAASDYYGIVPDIPEPFHYLIAPKAVALVRAEHGLAAKKRVTVDESWFEMFRETLLAYAGSDDVANDSIFWDNSPDLCGPIDHNEY